MAPGSLPSVVVYPDGTIVRSGYETAAGEPQRALAGYDGRLDDATLATLVAEARAADLTLGGVGVNGTTQGTADGGGTRFVARLDGTETAFEVPFLSSGDDAAAGDPAQGDAGGDPQQRAALAVVADHLRALGTQVAVNPRRGARWAVLAAPSTESSADGRRGRRPIRPRSTPPPAWCRRAPRSVWSPAPRCGAGCWRPATIGWTSWRRPPNGWLTARVAGTLWALGIRPLLPHEHTCTDVATSVADQHLAELADLRGR